MFESESHLRRPLERAMYRILVDMEHQVPGSEEWTRSVDALTKLSKIKEEEKPDSLSKDTFATIAANLLGILLIISHERVNVISTRAFGLLLKPR
jgi:hypothetical protein